MSFIKNVKRVAVIGGGPCGVATVKALLKEKSFDKVVAFERRQNTGGLWNYYNEEYDDQKLAVPSVDPHNNLQTPFKVSKDKYVWPSAIYELLDTNVPHKIMEYHDFHFPKGSPIFPLKSSVLEYIQAYSKEVEDNVQFNTNVVDVSLTPESKYSITYRNVVDSTEGGVKKSEEEPHSDKVEEFDAVLIAAGHYDQPFVPDRPGLKEYSEKYPGSVSHAKSYKHPRQFKNVEGNILIIGNSASGSDLAYQLATGLQRPIYKSARSKSQLPAGSSEFIKTVADVESVDPETKDVKLVDGTVIPNVERILYATGYLRHFPFLKSFNESKTPFITNGSRVERLNDDRRRTKID
ncbi:unnamed protein product [Ambrosiozyma monospora]|uniref:Unnamed protein product n=1 Tax=Ambrosiozyma monospora TaxID=43982 RepID=A0ACB5TAT0_AMBMO|nr:unnamed protein product [Ambrosiozyma monospora]